ncbi:MAG: type II toxin-antitoxin system PrlF family antitoxin [Desulfobacterales bacterium]|jgi:AbrB family looped-hinge helix DNA binding protein
MQHAISSKLTAKCQTTIPEKIRKILDLHPGDSVTFEVASDKKVTVRKTTPIDIEFTRALEGTLASEWLSENDEAAYSDL